MSLEQKLCFLKVLATRTKQVSMKPVSLKKSHARTIQRQNV
jgi:hypothetical protein